MYPKPLEIRQIMRGIYTVLQQKWEVSEGVFEWRDVPTVPEGTP